MQENVFNVESERPYVKMLAYSISVSCQIAGGPMKLFQFNRLYWKRMLEKDLKLVQYESLYFINKHCVSFYRL